MYVLGVVGPSNSGKTTLVERLTAELDEMGTVATIKHCTHEPDLDTAGKDTAKHRAAGADVTYGLTEDHGWFGTGTTRSLDETLDELAPDYDYAILEGFHWANVPQVVLGGRDNAGETLLSAPEANAVEVDEVVNTLHETEPYVTLGSLVADVQDSPLEEQSGAIATFTGRVRRLEHPDDEPTEFLAFEKYEGVAAERLDELCQSLEARDGVLEVAAHHKTGVIEAGEDIVFVVVLAGHRREAFRAVEDGIDRLKEEVPIFKKEVTVDDEFWRHEVQ